jgi:hypothetical protein
MRTPEQNDLAAAVRGLLGKRADSGAVRAAMESELGYDAELWATLCNQIGVAELELPDAAVVLEELGYSLAPNPLPASVVAREALAGTGRDDLLDRIAAGEVATVVTGNPVLYGAEAGILLAVDGDGIVLIDPSEATIEPVPALDPTLRLAHVTVNGGTSISSDGADRVRAAHLIAVCASAVGTAQRALDMTVGYSKERVQFGRQIGSFQALKHRMADMLVLVEMTRSAAWSAAAGDLDPAVAASYCLDALQKVVAETVQLHGGIAITWEHDAHLVFKRAHALTQLAGAPHRLRATAL